MTAPRLHSSTKAASRASRRAAYSAIGCSAATAQKVAPISVSARVVKTQSCRCSAPSSYGNASRTPSERPIQFFCISFTCSGQPAIVPSAASSSSA